MRWIIALLIVLAGCTDAPLTGDGPAPSVITDPADYTYIGNATLDNGGHIHDYWNGQERLQVLDTQETGIVGMFGVESITVHVFRPEDAVVIPQGTSDVEVTVSWVNHALDRNGAVELWVQTAADNVPQRVAELTSGELVSLSSTNLANDLPHQLLSAWQFHIVAYQPESQIPGRWNAETTIVAEAVRGLELPVFPAHPDPWNGSAEIVLIDEARTNLYQTQDPYIQGCFGPDCMYMPYDLNDGAIVPRDADKVRVEITWAENLPSSLALMVHPADTRAWSMPEELTDQPNHRVYEIPVEGGMGDGPYALQSLWEFNVYIDDPSMMFSGDYTMKVTAIAA